MALHCLEAVLRRVLVCDVVCSNTQDRRFIGLILNDLTTRKDNFPYCGKKISKMRESTYLVDSTLARLQWNLTMFCVYGHVDVTEERFIAPSSNSSETV